jgi:threonine/homoserine/homoserine lactone efflux protein
MTELFLGAGLGWGAGIIPGPLHTLIMVTSIRKGFRAGATVALAPPLADIPVIPISLLVVGAMSDGIVRGLSVAGGLFVVWLGYDTIRNAAEGPATDSAPGSDLLKGVVTNLLSPHPWLFWLTVGAPILVVAWSDNPASALGFLAGFYGVMVATKIAVAYLASHGKKLDGTPWYTRLLVGSGVLLLAMGALLIWEAVAR